MKARVKATGEIVEVIAVGDYINENGQIIGEYKDANAMPYNSYDLDFYIEEGITIPDYWTHLEHQYAGMAMEGLVTRGEVLGSSVQEIARDIAEISCEIAHALVKKIKEIK